MFRTDFTLNASKTLTIDTALIAADPPTSGNNYKVTLDAPVISLLNSAGFTSAYSGAPANASTMAINAGNLSIGHGNVQLAGFQKVGMTSTGDVAFKGIGSLTLGGSDLAIAAPRVTISYYSDANTAYESAAFGINAGSNKVSMVSGSGSAGQDSVPGGSLAVNAGRIELSTILQVTSGQVKLTATGDGISLYDGAQILARGSDYGPGGDVQLRADTGSISIASNTNKTAPIDVSGGSQGDAGSISLYAPTGGVALAGSLMGQAGKKFDGTYGLGGSFSMVTNTLDNRAQPGLLRP